MDIKCGFYKVHVCTNSVNTKRDSSPGDLDLDWAPVNMMMDRSQKSLVFAPVK